VIIIIIIIIIHVPTTTTTILVFLLLLLSSLGSSITAAATTITTKSSLIWRQQHRWWYLYQPSRLQVGTRRLLALVPLQRLPQQCTTTTTDIFSEIISFLPITDIHVVTYFCIINSSLWVATK
jgi:hypothetical protein